MKLAAELSKHTESCLPSFSFDCERDPEPCLESSRNSCSSYIITALFSFQEPDSDLDEGSLFPAPFWGNHRHKCCHEFWDSSHACGVPYELIMSDRCLDAVMHAQTPTVVFGNHGDDGEGS